METHQLKPAAIGSGREARAGEGPEVPRRPTPDRVCLGAGGAGRARQWGGAPRVPAHPRPGGDGVGDLRPRAPPCPASCRTRPAAGPRTRTEPRVRPASAPQGPLSSGREPAEHAQAHLVDCSPSSLTPDSPWQDPSLEDQQNSFSVLPSASGIP